MKYSNDVDLSIKTEDSFETKNLFSEKGYW